MVRTMNTAILPSPPSRVIRPAATRSTSVAVGALVVLAATGCGGYAELPMPVRESAHLVAEYVDLHPDAMGQLQLAVDLPADVVGPLVVVAAPAVRSTRPVVVNWAVGPCRDAAGQDVPQTLAVTSLLTVCAAVYTTGGVTVEPFTVDMVVEERHAGRRFNVSGTVDPK